MVYFGPWAGLRRSRVPSRPAGRDPGRDGTGFFKGIFEKTRPVEIVQKTFGIASLILKKLAHSNTFIKVFFQRNKEVLILNLFLME